MVLATGQFLERVGHVDDSATVLRRDPGPLGSRRLAQLQTPRLVEEQGERAAVRVRPVAHVSSVLQAGLGDQLEARVAWLVGAVVGGHKRRFQRVQDAQTDFVARVGKLL